MRLAPTSRLMGSEPGSDGAPRPPARRFVALSTAILCLAPDVRAEAQGGRDPALAGLVAREPAQRIAAMHKLAERGATQESVCGTRAPCARRSVASATERTVALAALNKITGQGTAAAEAVPTLLGMTYGKDRGVCIQAMYSAAAVVPATRRRTASSAACGSRSSSRARPRRARALPCNSAARSKGS
jgi:hypothetical protein